MTELSSTLFCSILANVMGIMFYDGLPHLKSLQHVQLERDRSSFQDTNAISYYMGKTYFTRLYSCTGSPGEEYSSSSSTNDGQDVAGVIRWY